MLTTAATAGLMGHGLAEEAPSAPTPNQQREFHRIAPNDQVPTVRTITPIDGSNVLFLNHRGQLGIAKFTPGLSQIGWQLYSSVKLNTLPSLAMGPGYSVLCASPEELTQCFDTDQNAELDFFQAVVADWPGRDGEVTITAGPVADSHGRVLFALSPHSLKEGAAPKARLMAWVPATGDVSPVTESELLIESFALRRDGLLAARLALPDYTDGYFLSLTELPPPPAAGAEPAPLPFTLPSLIIPAELTARDRPLHPAFLEEKGTSKLVLTCPVSKRLIEVTPEKPGGMWQGAILLRGMTEKPVHALAEIAPGALLGGGDEGFFALADDPAVYRIRRIAIAEDGVVLTFSQPVDRFEAVKASTYSVKTIALGGGEKTLEVEPVIESDGTVVVLRSGPVPAGHVLRVVCQNLPSEAGASLLSSSVFYTMHGQ